MNDKSITDFSLYKKTPNDRVRARTRYWICLLLVVATVAVFGQMRHHGFIDFDDPEYVTENPHVTGGLKTENIIWAFKSLYAANWHPLTWLSHMLDVELYGLNPGPHHQTSLLLHTLNSLLLFVVLCRMTGFLWPSAFVAALFALHPLHVESVALIAFRKDVLSGFFFMLTLLCYVNYVNGRSSRWYWALLICFALGLMAKPMLVTLPFVLLLLDYWPLARFCRTGNGTSEGPMRKYNTMNALLLVREKIPLFVLTLASCVITFIAQHAGGAVMSVEVNPWNVRVANMLVSYVKYLSKTFWPTKLAVFYPHPGTLPLWQSAGAFLLLLCLSFLVIRAGKKRPWLIVGWLWFLGMLVPVIGIVQVGSQAMADRYTYLPIIGIFIMAAFLVPDMLQRLSYRNKILAPLSVVLIAVTMTVTRAQVALWKDSLSLFEHALAVTGQNFLAENNIGVLLERKGRTAEALVHYRKALDIYPHFTNALNNMGNVLASMGKMQEALGFYQKALLKYPHSVQVHYNLGNFYRQQGKLDKAVQHYQKALERDPFFAQAHNNLGVAFAMQEKKTLAEAHFREAIRIRPDHSGARINLDKISGNSDARELDGKK